MRTFLIVASAAIFLLSLLCWGWLSGMGDGIGVSPPGLTAPLIAYVLPATGVGAGLSIGMLAFQFSRFSRQAEPAAPTAEAAEGERAPEPARELSLPARPQADRAALLLGFSIGGLVILLLVAAIVREIEPASAAVIIICGTLTLFAGMHVVEGLARGDTIEVSSHWGGLGGAMGGWRLSPIATLLVVALILLGTTLAASGAFSGKGEDKASRPAANQQRPAADRPSPANNRPGATGNQRRPAASRPAATENDVAAPQAAAAGNAL